MSGPALSRVNWSAADAEKQAAAIFNEGIVDYIKAYQQGGTAAMGNVLDKKQEKSRADEYRALMAHSPYLVDYVKEFHDYLEAYPHGKLAGPMTSSSGRRTLSASSQWSPGTTRPSTRAPVAP